MRIKRFPDPPVEEQLKLLIDEPLETFCMYPTASVVEPRVDLSVWQHRPFSKALLLAEAQLSFRAFDMGALERYVADPRYDVHFEDYEGRMSVTNEFLVMRNIPNGTRFPYQSGEVDYVGGISKCGDRRVRTLLYEAANVMLTVTRASSS